MKDEKEVKGEEAQHPWEVPGMSGLQSRAYNHLSPVDAGSELMRSFSL